MDDSNPNPPSGPNTTIKKIPTQRHNSDIVEKPAGVAVQPCRGRDHGTFLLREPGTTSKATSLSFRNLGVCGAVPLSNYSTLYQPPRCRSMNWPTRVFKQGSNEK